MNITISGTGYHIRAGVIDDDLVDSGEFDEISNWTSFCELLDVRAPNSDDCAFEINGEDLEVGTDIEPEPYGHDYLPSHWEIKADGAKYIAITIDHLSGEFGEIELEDTDDSGAVNCFSDAPEYGDNEYCLYTVFACGDKELLLNRASENLVITERQHLIIDLEGDEVVTEFTTEPGDDGASYTVRELDTSLGYRRDGDGSVLYLFNGDIDSSACSQVVRVAYSETTDTGDLDFAEYDPSTIVSSLGQIEDDMPLAEALGGDPGNIDALINDLKTRGTSVVYVDIKRRVISSKVDVQELRASFSDAWIFAREYDHLDDY